MNRIEIAPKVFLTTLPNEKFKKNRVSISFVMPNTRQSATCFALLPGVMERAYEEYPDMRDLSRKLNRMYSASLSVSNSVIGQNRSIRFTIQGIKNEYCLNNEDLLKEMCQLLSGVIFKPCLENGAFIESWIDVEKFKLKEEIEGEVNDKRGYCVKNANRKFFEDSLNGIERLGYLEDIDAITPKQLYNCYEYMINHATIEIFITASQPQTATDTFEKVFNYKRENLCDVLPVQIMPCSDVRSFEEKFDTTQGKVCLMYTTGVPLTQDQRYHMLVASALYGGTASSRLFKNVREKQSLCYYCAAGFNGFTSSLRVDSGVEHQNIQLVINAVQKELSDLIIGEITEEEIEQTKLIIKNNLTANYDGLHGLEAWYLNEALRGTDNTPEQVMEIVDKVTKADIQSVLKLLHLNVIYTITK